MIPISIFWNSRYISRFSHNFIMTFILLLLIIIIIIVNVLIINNDFSVILYIL